MTTSDVCPLCEVGVLRSRVVMTAVEYGGKSATLPTELSACDHCGSEQADAGQLRNNKRAMMAFRKSVDGLLTGAQVRALREWLGLTQAQAAQLFGGGPVAFSKYESDDVAQSEAMDKLLRLAEAVPEAFGWLLERAKMPMPQGMFGAGWTDVATELTISVVECGQRPLLKLVRSKTWEPEPELKYA